MPDFNAWLSDVTPLVDSQQPATRAALEWRHVLDVPTRVVLNRAGVKLPAQTVRIDVNGGGGEIMTPQGTLVLSSATLFGVQGHPDADVPDTDVQRGDRFVYADQEYEVTSVVPYPGGVQASAEIKS